MKIFTTKETEKTNRSRLKTWAGWLFCAIFWIGLWEFFYQAVDQEILIPSPVSVFYRLGELVVTPVFWQTALYSLWNVVLGLLWGTAAGVLTAVLISVSKVMSCLLRPVLAAAKATPVASFIILALVWISRVYVPSFIGGLIVFPVVCGNVAQGLRETDRLLLEKAQVFRISKWRVFLYVVLPGIFPYFLSAMVTSLGLAWKAGIAAEVLCTPKGAIGTQLYNAKIYIETTDLFAWTFVVVILSLLLEFAFVRLTRRFSLRIPLKARTKKEKSSEPVSEVPSLPPLTKHFGERLVLDHFSLPVQAGRVTALLGPSGEGKTTCLRIWAGLEIDDNGVTGTGTCAFLFQENRLLPGRTARENILFVRQDADVDRLLELVELTDSADLPVEQLSGGMKRRVALAAMLTAPAPLVLLDEPFQGLDPALRDRVAARVFEDLRGSAVVLVTHDPKEAEQFADEIVQM